MAVATPRGSQPRREWNTFEEVRNTYQAGGFNMQQAQALIGGTETLLGGVLERFDKRFDEIDKRFDEKDKKDEKRFTEIVERFEEIGKRFEAQKAREYSIWGVIALTLLAIFFANPQAADTIKFVFPFLPK